MVHVSIANVLNNTYKYYDFRILAELKHPNIVAYHDSFFDEASEHLCILQVSLNCVILC